MAAAAGSPTSRRRLSVSPRPRRRLRARSAIGSGSSRASRCGAARGAAGRRPAADAAGSHSREGASRSRAGTRRPRRRPSAGELALLRGRPRPRARRGLAAGLDDLLGEPLEVLTGAGVERQGHDAVDDLGDARACGVAPEGCAASTVRGAGDRRGAPSGVNVHSNPSLDDATTVTLRPSSQRPPTASPSPRWSRGRSRPDSPRGSSSCAPASAAQRRRLGLRGGVRSEHRNVDSHRRHGDGPKRSDSHASERRQDPHRRRLERHRRLRGLGRALQPGDIH